MEGGNINVVERKGGKLEARKHKSEIINGDERKLLGRLVGGNILVWERTGGERKAREQTREFKDVEERITTGG